MAIRCVVSWVWVVIFLGVQGAFVVPETPYVTDVVQIAWLKTDYSELVPFKNGVAFTAENATHGKEMFISDGTLAGTKVLKDIFPGPVSLFPMNPSDWWKAFL